MFSNLPHLKEASCCTLYFSDEASCSPDRNFHNAQVDEISICWEFDFDPIILHAFALCQYFPNGELQNMRVL